MVDQSSIFTSDDWAIIIDSIVGYVMKHIQYYLGIMVFRHLESTKITSFKYGSWYKQTQNSWQICQFIKETA